MRAGVNVNVNEGIESEEDGGKGEKRTESVHTRGEREGKRRKEERRTGENKKKKKNVGWAGHTHGSAIDRGVSTAN